MQETPPVFTTRPELLGTFGVAAYRNTTLFANCRVIASPASAHLRSCHDMTVPKELSLGKWKEMVGAFHGESDRGAAILAGSFAEHALGQYLKFRVRDKKIADALFGAIGPLSSFSQRIAIAYAFDLI